MAPPSARLLDLTRLVSRAGKEALTGVDRVELAYLRTLLDRPIPLFALVRTTLGFALLDRKGAAALLPRLTRDTPWGRADLLGRLSQRHAPGRAQAESDLRRLCIARARPRGLARMLVRHLPAGTAYINVGHANLSGVVFAAVKTLADARITVLIHDTIPLDYPAYSAPGVPAAFADRLARVGAAADLVVYNSAQSRRDAERHFARWGRVPPGLVAYLGVDLPIPDLAALPQDLPPRPYFVTLGTIEPRKNHALLLDLWDDMLRDPPPGGCPGLLILGRRGWNNADVFRRLDALGPTSPIREIAGLNDSAVAAALANSAGLLFPSLAEGFGLPPLEAAALGVPTICNNLEIYQEILGNYPVYAPVNDRYLWHAALGDLTKKAGRQSGMTAHDRTRLLVPNWADHFGPVLGLT
ncbi:MAG: glycosyltransferase [Paracoccaceae bacterium]|nr:glycosyltransferase [Paracoccaceae bacterium]